MRKRITAAAVAILTGIAVVGVVSNAVGAPGDRGPTRSSRWWNGGSGWWCSQQEGCWYNGGHGWWWNGNGLGEPA